VAHSAVGEVELSTFRFPAQVEDSLALTTSDAGKFFFSSDLLRSVFSSEDHLATSIVCHFIEVSEELREVYALLRGEFTLRRVVE